MKSPSAIPRFVSVVAIGLGCLDLVRGFMHTFLLGYAARNIAGLDLSTPQAIDLLRLLGTFGISNYVTGLMLILVGWKARPLALAMLGAIPALYGIGILAIKANVAPYGTSQAAWGGAQPLLVYMVVSLVTFIAGGWITLHRKRGG